MDTERNVWMDVWMDIWWPTEKVSEIWTVSRVTCGGVAASGGRWGLRWPRPNPEMVCRVSAFSTGPNVGTEAAVPTFAPGPDQQRLLTGSRDCDAPRRTTNI